MKNKKWRQSALAFSFFLFVLWWALGTSATLAWFNDADTVRNEFHIGLLNLDVSFRNSIVTQYTPLDGTTEAFNDQALYEPGYTQVVYLKIENNGEVDFKYKVAVTIEDFTKGKNAMGDDIYLPDFLRYGVIFGETEAEVEQTVAELHKDRNLAPNEWGALDTWSEISPYTFEVGEDPHYAALIVYMPDEVDNAANYRGFTQPQVQLGITVFAQQANAPIE